MPPENPTQSIDKNLLFNDYLLALEDKWMEKDIINCYIRDCGGTLNFVTFRFLDEGEDYYFVCEIEVEDLDSLPVDVEEKILNEIEWAYDDIRDDLESEGLDLEGYLGDKLIIKRVD